VLQITHVRSLHTSGGGQLQEAVAVQTEPEPISVCRTQESDPVTGASFMGFCQCIPMGLIEDTLEQFRHANSYLVIKCLV